MAPDAASALNWGFFLELFIEAGDPQTAGKEPVLQILHLAQMNRDAKRWRIVLSDGDNSIQGMLSQQCAEMAEQNIIETGNIVRLKQFTASNVKGKRVIIVISMDVLEEYGKPAKIGSPEPLPPKSEQQDQGPQQPNPISGQGFYGNNVKQETPAPKKSLPSRSTNANHHGNIYTIEMLSPYQSKWTIKARVTSKSKVKTWQNDRGEGKLFSFNLLDETGEIRATAFGDQCEAYYDVIEENSVYYISSPCTVKMARKQFSNLSNDYELTFDRETVVEKAEEQQDVPQIRYNFTSLADLAQVAADSVVDTIGVLREVEEVKSITSNKTNRTFQKRELTIVDETNFEVRLTIWGNLAQEFDIAPDSVVAFKGVKVSDFNGRSLSLLSTGTMNANPDIDQAYRLKGWYDAQGRMENFSDHHGLRSTGNGSGKNLSLKTIERIKEEHLGTENAEYFDVKATITHFSKGTNSYPACPSPPERKCNKKVLEEPDGTWRCEKCEFTASEPQWRFILNLSLSDYTGQCRATCFDDIGRFIVGMDAKQLKDTAQENSIEEHDVLSGALWGTYIFNCRATMERYQDEERTRYTILKATPIDYVSESKKLAGLISSYD